MNARFALLAAALMAAAIAAPARGADVPPVQTQSGPVVGTQSGGMVRFLGLPYAAPPTGALRWMPPAPPKPWTAPRNAKAFGPACAQITTLGPFAGPANANEDCLYLNVFAPVGATAKKFPVLFWMHGGGYFDGRSNDYDPSKLVKQNLVVVSINYRLGLFGYLAHPALDGEGHLFGNYGELDQQAALRWVRDNIAAFGGDKDNVTIGGQSAGAGAALYNIISPLGKGLFHRAIIESAGNIALVPLAAAEAKGTKFAAAAGCTQGPSTAVAACLRKLSPKRILALSGTESENSPYITGPLVDGQIVPEQVNAAVKAGHFAHVPFMIGMTQDEGNFPIGIDEFFAKPRRAVSAADAAAYAAKSFGGNAGPGDTLPAYPKGTVNAVLAHYPLSAFADAQAMKNALYTDPRICRSRYLASGLAPQVPVYDYEFDDRTAPTYFPAMPGYTALAYHTSDLQYLFPGYHGGPKGIPHTLNAAQQRLSDQLVRFWANFARSGNPNDAGNKAWPRFEPAAPAYLSQNVPSVSVLTDSQIVGARKCDFWQTILIY